MGSAKSTGNKLRESGMNRFLFKLGKRTAATIREKMVDID
jgi:hypothetical protein